MEILEQEEAVDDEDAAASGAKREWSAGISDDHDTLIKLILYYPLNNPC
jgi:hypothetical protein